MKTFFSFIIMLTTFSQQSIAQQPRTEFTLSLSETQVEIKPGEAKTVELKLLRSKGYSKSKAKFGLSSSLPDGVTLTYEPSEGVIQTSAATISVSSNVKPGTYLLVPECTLNHKSKGTMLKLVVTENAPAVTGLH